MKRKHYIVIALVVVFLLSLLLIYNTFALNLTKDHSSTEAQNASSEKIIFPAGGETLQKGEQYTLEWTPGNGKTQIFLKDTSLETQGESVSIADRVYNIDNAGRYEYTIPQHIPDGTYKFEIGTLTSNTFKISSTSAISYCSPEQLQARLMISPAAGNIYGTFTIQNISLTSCDINGNKLIDVHYPQSVQNISVVPYGSPSLQTVSLSPNQTLYAQLHYPNGPQCSTSTLTTPLTFSYAISPSAAITFANNNGEKSYNANTCKLPTETTTIQVGYLSTQPITR